MASKINSKALLAVALIIALLYLFVCVEEPKRPPAGETFADYEAERLKAESE